MSLAKALSWLPQDVETELAVRDVLLLLRKHRGEWLTAEEAGRRTGHAPEALAPVLAALARAYVVRLADARPPAYRFDGDVGASVEIDSFVRRVRAERAYAETNVARFRRRYDTMG